MIRNLAIFFGWYLVAAILGNCIVFAGELGEMKINIAFPQERWAFQLGTRLPVAGQLSIPLDGAVPEKLLCRVERTHDSVTDLLGQTTARLERVDEQSYNFLDFVWIDSRTNPAGGDCSLSIFPMLGDRRLTSKPVLNAKLRIDCKASVHWGQERLGIVHSSQLPLSQLPSQGVGVLSLGVPDENLTWEFLPGGNFYVYGDVKWKPTTANPPVVLYLMFEEQDHRESRTLLFSAACPAEQVRAAGPQGRPGSRLPQALLDALLPLPKEYSQEAVYVRAVFLGEGTQKIGETNLVRVNVRVRQKGDKEKKGDIRRETGGAPGVRS